jgi:hypothetical protein
LEEEENLGSIPFRFSPLWIGKEGFLETVLTVSSTPVTGSPSFLWEKKLKAMKHALKAWIKNPNNTTSSHRRETDKQLSNLQMEMERKDITKLEIDKEQVDQSKSFRAFHQEEE